MFSAYMLDPTFGWIAIHRLPLKDAIYYCQQCRRQPFGEVAVAIVPDRSDPAPYLALAERLA